MKSNQLTDKHLRDLSLLSNCKWPTSSSTFSFCSPNCSSSHLTVSPSCETAHLPPSWNIAINSSCSLVRSTWSYVIISWVKWWNTDTDVAIFFLSCYERCVTWLCRPYMAVMIALLSSFSLQWHLSPPTPTCAPLSTFPPPPCMPCVHPPMCAALTLFDPFAWAACLVVRTTDNRHPHAKPKAWCLASCC